MRMNIYTHINSLLVSNATKYLRTLLLALGLLFAVSMETFGQDDSWTLQTTVDNVDLQYKIVDCGEKKAVLMRFDNKNDFSVQVSWRHIIGSTLVPNTTVESSDTFSIVIGSGTTAPENCEDSNLEALVILPTEVDPTYIADITNFSFSSVTVVENK